VWLFAAFLVLLVAAAVVLATRRFLLERSGGTVECALRRLNAGGDPDHVGLPWHGLGHGGWRLGVLSYQRDELYWYGALGVLMRPEQVFQRRALAVVSRRPADEAEVAALGVGRIVVEVAAKQQADASGAAGPSASPDEGRWQLAMSDAALTGFLAWLEASPPGSHLADFGLSRPRPRSTPDRSRTDRCSAWPAPLPVAARTTVTGRRPGARGRPRCRRWRPGRG
jgi:hypothetical protein